MRMVYILGGVIAFALGTVGTVLPVLPTVPFYLLATWCFAKSSRRLHDWLHARTLYQKHMTPFFNGEGLSIRQKVTMMSIYTTQYWFWESFPSTSVSPVMVMPLMMLLIPSTSCPSARSALSSA